MTETPEPTRILENKYEIVAEIGRGAMGVVYQAIQRSLGRPVAIKRLPAHLAMDDEFVQRFRREAHALARLNHAHIVAVHDMEKDGDQYLLVMEFVEGQSLRALLQEKGPLAPREAARIAAEVAAALDAAHRCEVVHRDVKPDNILIRKDTGSAKVTDFGIASVAGSDFRTMTPSMIGTPKYMSPEQVQGKQVSGTADVYALGIVLYEMLSGRPPFLGNDPLAVAHQQIHEAPPDLAGSTPGLPPALLRIVARALEKDPERRFATAGAMEAALRGYLSAPEPVEPVPREARRVPRKALIAGGGILAALIAVVLLRVFVPGGGTASLSPVTDLSVASIEPGRVTLTWTAPPGRARPARYDLRMGERAFDAASFENALSYPEMPLPGPAGRQEQVTVTGLLGDARSFFALRPIDANGVQGEISNVVEARIPDGAPPARVTDLEVARDEGSALLLSWTAPGDNDRAGHARAYDLRMASGSLDASSFPQARPIPVDPPRPAGARETARVEGIDARAPLRFALKTSDEVPLWSELSNVAVRRGQPEPRGEVPQTEPKAAGAPVSTEDRIAVQAFLDRWKQIVETGSRASLLNNLDAAAQASARQVYGPLIDGCPRRACTLGPASVQAGGSEGNRRFTVRFLEQIQCEGGEASGRAGRHQTELVLERSAAGWTVLGLRWLEP
jgi:hypothetical protein